MRKFVTLSLTAFALLAGCSDSRDAIRSRTAPKPILVDEYSVLDDRQAGKPLSDQALKLKLEEARRHYLLAMRSSERGNVSLASRHFESAMTILNDLITYPNIYSNPEFTKLSEGIIRDYEEQITSIDSLDANSSFFVLRDKIFQEIETIPVERRRYPGQKEQMTGIPGQLQIALDDNVPVQQCIAFFTSEKGRKFFGRWLERSGRFFPLYERIMEEEGAPQELRYLSMIESGLSPTAVSWAKAVGLWQFIPSTGQMYGLTINWWVDERRNPEKATRAAARYLLDLYHDLGDWHLALASYNCGPGRVKSAIKKAGSRDYWEVRKYLPRETQQYVPLYIAAAKITMDPEAYGFTNLNFEEPDEFDLLPVKGTFDIAAIAETANLPVDDLKALNPEVLRGRISSEATEYQLRVPRGTPRELADRINELPPPPPTALATRHKVRKGESIAAIAKRYGVESSAILEANEMTPKSKVRSGMTLRIPAPSSTAPAAGEPAALASVDNASQPAAEQTAKPRPVVASPETGGEIPAPIEPARIEQSKVEPTPIALNATVKSEPRRESKTIAAASSEKPAPVTTAKAEPQRARYNVHTVSRGQTLTGIAHQHGVAAKDLAAWNGLTTGSEVRIGQKLKIDASADARGDLASSATPSVERRAAATKKESKLSADKKERSERLASRDDQPTGRSRKRSVTTTTTRFETHKVRRGQSLAAIADEYGVSVEDLKAWNGRDLKGNKVMAGSKLKIYSESTSKGDARRSSRASKSAPKKYSVRRGDTMEEIATKFGVSVAELRKSNPGVKPGKLRTGQALRIQK